MNPIPWFLIALAVTIGYLLGSWVIGLAVGLGIVFCASVIVAADYTSKYNDRHR